MEDDILVIGGCVLALDLTFIAAEHGAADGHLRKFACEYGPARVQDKALLQPILAASMAFTRHIDRAAASMYALQAEVLPAQGIPVQGVGREAYRS